MNATRPNSGFPSWSPPPPNVFTGQVNDGIDAFQISWVEPRLLGIPTNFP
jgi:hypothetical protein